MRQHRSVRLEDVLDAALEHRCQPERERQAGIEAFLFDRNDRQTRHFDPLGKFGLRPTQFDAAASYIVFHVFMPTALDDAESRSASCTMRTQ